MACFHRHTPISTAAPWQMTFFTTPLITIPMHHHISITKLDEAMHH